MANLLATAATHGGVISRAISNGKRFMGIASLRNRSIAERGTLRANESALALRDYRDEACAIANHSLEPALANSAPAHLLQSFWLLSEHWACAAELSKPVFFNTTFCE